MEADSFRPPVRRRQRLRFLGARRNGPFSGTPPSGSASAEAVPSLSLLALVALVVLGVSQRQQEPQHVGESFRKRCQRDYFVGLSSLRGGAGGPLMPYGSNRHPKVDTSSVHAHASLNRADGDGEGEKKKSGPGEDADADAAAVVDALATPVTPRSGTIANVWGEWSAPPLENVLVRGKTYLDDKIKQPVGEAVFPLVHVDVIKAEDGLIHSIGERKGEWVVRHREKALAQKKDPGYTVVINLQIGSLGVSVVSYHHLPSGLKPKPGGRLPENLAEILRALPSTEKEELDERFKLITHLEKGPILMRAALKTAVGANRPVVMGKSVHQRYHFGPDYMEVDVEVDTSIIAKGILKIAAMFVKSVVVDMVWVIEGKTETELPEKALAAVRLGNVELSQARPTIGPSPLASRAETAAAEAIAAV